MRKRTKQFALGTAVAAGMGYLTGVLTAPKSGKETRNDIKNAAVKAKKEAEQKLKVLHGELTSHIETVQSQLTKASVTSKKSIKEALVVAQGAKQKVREMLSAVHEGDAEDADLKEAINEASKAIQLLKKYLKKDAKDNQTSA